MLKSVEKARQHAGILHLARINQFLPQLPLPPFHTLKRDLGIVKSYVHDSLNKIVRPSEGLLPYPYLIPTAPAPGDPNDRLKGVYFQMYDWDAFFEGVRLCQEGKSGFLKDVVLNFLSHARSDGYTPRTISPERYWDGGDQCKPFLCQGALLACRASGDYSWVDAETYHKLKLTLSYWENNRRTRDGLFVWRNALESGVDNSFALLLAHPMTVAGVDLNCYMAREYKAMSLLAAKIGNKEDARGYSQKGRRLVEKINKFLWDEEDQMYHGLDVKTGKPVRIKDWTAFVPLWMGIAPPDKGKALIENHLLNENEFWGPYGVRSLSSSEEVYNNARRGFISEYHTVSNWQGPVWFLPNYMMVKGLWNYGYKERSVGLAKKMVRLLADDISRSGATHENYDAETGKPLGAPRFASWNLLADRILDMAKTGVDITEF